MKKYWTQIELIENWTLSKTEIEICNAKDAVGFYGLSLKYYDLYGSFLEEGEELSNLVVRYVAKQLKVKKESILNPSCTERSIRQYKKEIREYYGFSRLSAGSKAEVSHYIKENLLPQGLGKKRIIKEVCNFFYDNKIERLRGAELTRFINSECNKYEQELVLSVNKKLNDWTKGRLKALIKEVDSDGEVNYSKIKQNPGKLTKTTIKEELARLEYVKITGVLDIDLRNVSMTNKVLKKYHDNVIIKSPSELLKICKSNKDKFNFIVYCFCKYKAGRIVDNLIDISIKKIRRMERKGLNKAKQDLWEIEENEQVLYDSLVDISLEKPEGVIREAIYPNVGGKSKLEKAKELREMGKIKKKVLEYESFKCFYIQHRQYILEILEQSDLRSGSENLIFKALQYILQQWQKDEGSDYFEKEDVAIDGILLAKDLLVMEHDCGKINKIYYELAVLRKLKKELNNRNIWSSIGLKYTNPKKWIPEDYEERKEHYLDMLGLDKSAEKQIGKIKHDLVDVTIELNKTILDNPKVRIGKKGKKAHVFIIPSEAQEEPENISILKRKVLGKWGYISLLDILKEADLRIGLTAEIIDTTDKIAIERDVLQQRLLLCIYAAATNTELKRVCIGIDGVTVDDLKYVKKRYLTPEVMRYVIQKLIDATLDIRDKEIFGELESVVGSDSTQIAAWPGNLMSEFHVRYKENGIMAYWHVEKKALCISSQAKRCCDPETVSMLVGIINHKTKLEIKGQPTDSNGQSLIAFAICHLLGINLQPRIKRIGYLKISKADRNMAKRHYCNIEEVMGKAINWNLITSHYDEFAKHLIALKLGTIDPEVILKKLLMENRQSSLYMALLELGRAVRSIFICKYLMSEEYRIEIDEVLNVVENWNSGNIFIFFARRGIISSNNEVEHELTILSLHLLQSSLVYINTLLLQQIIKEEAFTPTIEDKRAITPLFYHHINQYGVYKLNMKERIEIEV